MEAQKKLIQSVIDSVRIFSPELHARLTVPAIYAYLKLPDSSFGWQGAKDNPIQIEAKILAVITHLRYGVQPGLGHILFLGSQLYVTAKCHRTIANRDPEWKWLKKKYRPHTAEERKMLYLMEGDLSIKLEARVSFKGVECDFEGDGVIDARELSDSRIKWNQSRKNILMTLKTRAERDLLNREYPLEGVAGVLDPDDEERIINVTPDSQGSPPQSFERQGATKAADCSVCRQQLKERVSTLRDQGAKDESLKSFLFIKDWKETEAWDLERLETALEALDEFEIAEAVEAEVAQ